MSVESTLSFEYIEKGMITLEQVVTHEGLTIAMPNRELTERMIELISKHKITFIKVKFDPVRFPKAAKICEQKAEAKKEPPVSALLEIESVIDTELRKDALGSIKKVFEVFGQAKGEEQQMTTAHLAIKEVDTIVNRLIDVLSNEADSLVHIEGLRSYDEYTYHHSLSVTVLAIAIGQSMSFSDEELATLGRAAMMHDIGKANIPHQLINKPGKLTDAEFRIVKNHTASGYKYLSMVEVGDENFRKIVLSHHEKVDGSGYPNKLAGDAIPFMSRIIAVADVYDAVTSYRSYRKPMTPSSAVELVMSEVGRAFDYIIVKTFVEKIELYPINTCIELSNERLGVVINNVNSMRPILRMLDNDEILDLMNLKNLSLIITRVIDDNQDK